MSFHEVRFPTEIARQSQGGPERRTDIVVLGSGHEERNARWADSRRNYNAGYGVKSLDDLHSVIGFFEERRGRLHGFRWRDPGDWKSCPPEMTPASADQIIGTGDGVRRTFQLIKTYGGAYAPWQRVIAKPVAGTVLVAVDEVTQNEGADFSVDEATGLVTFTIATTPAVGSEVRAGYKFDVPVRFDTDRLEINFQGFRHGAIPNIPIVEIRI
ncbi:MAG: TIGR02217 family protein [Hyphomicrobiaceae bacterium]